MVGWGREGGGEGDGGVERRGAGQGGDEPSHTPPPLLPFSTGHAPADGARTNINHFKLKFDGKRALSESWGDELRGTRVASHRKVPGHTKALDDVMFALLRKKLLKHDIFEIADVVAAVGELKLKCKVMELGDFHNYKEAVRVYMPKPAKITGASGKGGALG